MTLVKWNRGTHVNGNGQSPANYSNGLHADMPQIWPSLFNSFSRPLLSGDLIQNFFDDTMNIGTGSIGTTLPAVNISETNNELLIEVAAPGMKKNDFKVEINDNQLNISYRKETNSENDDKNHWRKEFNFQSFERNFTLPTIVESDKIEATYNEGILKIVVPKKEEARKKPAKTIEIK
jgi:HSP20 family protein